MRLRRAGIGDAPAIHQILDRVRDDGTLTPVEAALGDIEDFMQRDSSGAFIVERDGDDVGVALFDRQGDVFWLFRIVVLADARGRGAGRALVEAVEAAAGGAGASAVFVQIPKHFEARSFFETLGYKADIEEPDVVAGSPIVLVDLVKLVQRS